MECSICKHDNPEGARHCNSCGSCMGGQQPGLKKCVCCGKHMDNDVCLNVCQHCGFAYRISVSKPNRIRAPTRWTYVLMYYASFVVPGAGFLIGGVYMSAPGIGRRLSRDCAALGIANLAVVVLSSYYVIAWVL